MRGQETLVSAWNRNPRRVNDHIDILPGHLIGTDSQLGRTTDSSHGTDGDTLHSLQLIGE
jgi:hypothetical protein